MKKVFWRNAFFAILGRGLSVILGLMATPYIISRIGINNFGAWALLESIVAYFSLSDMGVGSSFTKFVAQYHTKKEYDNLSMVVSTGLLFYLVLGFIILLGSLLLKDWVLGQFSFKATSMEDIYFIYTSLVVVMCIRMTSMPFWSVVAGTLRYDILNKTKMSAQAINFFGILSFLYLGYGLKGLAINAVIYAVIDIIIAVTFAFHVVPALEIRFNYNIRDIFANLFKYGLAVQIVAISEIINAQIDKIFLGMFSNVIFVGMYEIGAKIANVTNSLAGVVLPILIPTTSHLNAAGHGDEIRSLYIRGTKLIALAVVPITASVAFHAESLVLLWMGKGGFEPAATAARFLTIGFSIYLIGGVGRLMSRGIGIPKYEMQGGVLISALNVILSYSMIRQWGIQGAVISSLISLAVGSVFFIVKFNKQVNVSNVRVLKLFMLPVLFSAVAFCPTLLLPAPETLEFLMGMTIRTQSFFYLVAVTIIAVPLYLFCIFLSSGTDEYSELRSVYKVKIKLRKQ